MSDEKANTPKRPAGRRVSRNDSQAYSEGEGVSVDVAKGQSLSETEQKLSATGRESAREDPEAFRIAAEIRAQAASDDNEK